MIVETSRLLTSDSSLELIEPLFCVTNVAAVVQRCQCQTYTYASNNFEINLRWWSARRIAYKDRSYFSLSGVYYSSDLSWISSPEVDSEWANTSGGTSLRPPTFGWLPRHRAPPKCLEYECWQISYILSQLSSL